MGVVYKARDIKLDRIVALKFLASHLLQNADSRERFFREAKAAAALDHPNICTVYEVDEAEGQPFNAMAHLEGHPLDERIDAGPLSIAQVLEIAMQAAEGLEAAHRKGVIHRDIKPENLIVMEASSRRIVKIMDFGLARLAGSSRLTRERASLGTVGYMSPEQTQGREVDATTDIWALGVVLYEMVTGRSATPPTAALHKLASTESVYARCRATRQCNEKRSLAQRKNCREGGCAKSVANGRTQESLRGSVRV
jgi:serine/threonine-protein kinase